MHVFPASFIKFPSIRKNSGSGSKMIMLKSAFAFISLFFFLFQSFAQTDTTVYPQASNVRVFDSTIKIFISSVNVTGNKKTKPYIIEREMTIRQGDSISLKSFFEQMELSRQLVYNTTLFTEVIITPFFNEARDVTLQVSVKEKWYIYPTPQFQLVDRNLNEWLKRYNADLERVVYGAKFAHYNLSGRRDQLRIFLLNGYARNISFIYSAPYSSRSLNEGFSTSMSFTQNREINFKTNSTNQLQQFKTDGFVRNTFNVAGSYLVRKGFYKRHSYGVAFTHIKVDDSVAKVYNPNYLDAGKRQANIPELNYTYQYIKTNNIQYPLIGQVHNAKVSKKGLGFTGGINVLTFAGDFSHFIDHGKQWYTSLETGALLKLPFRQAYINQQAMGYGNFYLRGLENYVIDGVASVLAKYTLKKKILEFNIPVPFKNKIIPNIPITIFAKTYADAGYSYLKDEPATRLGNRFLYSGGFGLDILTLYDMSFKLEYSFNQLGEKGLFLHAKGGF